MKEWLILGLTAYLFYSFSSSIDKHLMNEENQALSTNGVKMVLDGLTIFILGFFFLDLQFTWKALGYSTFLGFIYGLSGVLYFKTLQEMDVNRVIPALQSSKISLIFIFSALILEEIVSLYNIIGMIGVSIGVFAVLSRKGLSLPKIDLGIRYLVLSIITGVTYSILTKVFVAGINPETLGTMIYFTSGGFLLTFQALRRNLEDLKSVLTRQTFPKIGLAAFFGGTATLLLFKALEIANASKVYPLAGTQSVFILGISVIFLGEGLDLKKMIGVATVAVGVYLVQM